MVSGSENAREVPCLPDEPSIKSELRRAATMVAAWRGLRRSDPHNLKSADKSILGQHSPSSISAANQLGLINAGVLQHNPSGRPDMSDHDRAGRRKRNPSRAGLRRI